MIKYEKEIEVRWSDTDPNRHVRHSAYYEYGAHVRIRFFAENGFDSTKLSELNLGPVVFKEACSFIKEIHPNDTIRINLLKGQMKDDCSRWELHHEIFNRHGKCAHITLTGAWMNLLERKLTVPPVELAEAIFQLPDGEEYVYKKNLK